MKQETKTKLARRSAFVLALVIGLAIGAAIGVKITRLDAIKHDAAYYHPKTGENVWGHVTKESEVMAIVQAAIQSCKMNQPIGINVKDGLVDDVCNLVIWGKK